MKKVILDSGKIAYLRMGRKAKPKLLMLHGLFANSVYLKKTAKYLKKDFDILIPDFPGFGLSDKLKKKPNTLVSYADVIIELCDFLKFKPFHLVGASLGGMVSIVLASKYPNYIEKIIIQAAPWNKRCFNVNLKRKPFAAASKYKRIVKLAEKLKSKLKGKVLDLFLSVYSKDLLEISKQNGTVHYCFKTMDLEATAEIWGNLKDADLTNRARKIRLPTLIIVGSRDTSVPPLKVKLLSKVIRGAKFKTIRGGTHALFWDCPERVASIIKKFFAK